MPPGPTGDGEAVDVTEPESTDVVRTHYYSICGNHLLQRYHGSSFNCSQLSCNRQSGSGLSLGNPNGNPLHNDHQVLLLQNVMCLFILAADQVVCNKFL